jgi:serine/threonine-protein kinase
LFDAPPEAFGSYRVLEEIGSGRFGPIYRAQDASGAVVAVKAFDQGLAPEHGFAVAASLKELCRAPLDHPSIVPLIAAGLEGDRIWAAETWVDGSPLDLLMRRIGAQQLGDVLVRVTQIGAALDFAAAAGIHHGALHPRDILVAADRTVLTGLGMLQALGEAGLEVPMEGAYVSPQRTHGLPIAARDDIFSLAAITYELVYGTAVPERALLRLQMTALPGVDHTRFVDVFEGALSSDPLDRPSSALEFVAALQHSIIPIPIQHSEYRIQHSNSDSDSTIPIPIPIPQTHEAADLPLRVAEPESELRNSNANPNREFHSRNSESESEYGYWFGVAAALAIGLLTGFAGGFVAGQRDETPAPYRAERAVARTERQAPAEEKPAPTAGRDFTETAVPPPSSQSVPVTQAEPVRPPERTERNEPTERTERTEPEPFERSEPSERGSLQVDSRPRGARVFVDGRLVGTTPLLVPEVTSGSHAVRIDLGGYERWVTAVTVAPGVRQRVAASLTLIGER